MPEFRKATCAMLFPLLTASPLSGCTVADDFRRDPVLTTAAVALTPVVLPVFAVKAIGGARHPLNQQPMYGNQPKTAPMLAADQCFIEEAQKSGFSRAQASDKSVQLGWQYFQQRHDIATAMKRFNQAWLLDPDNGDAYHGFAVLVMERDHDAKQTEALFRRGAESPRQSPGLWLDYGRFLVMTRRPAEAVAPLRRALTFPDMGPDAQALLTLALARSGDLEAACAEKTGVQDGAQPVIRGAARALACVP
jgi:predicted Zn-dependent protease